MAKAIKGKDLEGRREREPQHTEGSVHYNKEAGSSTRGGQCLRLEVVQLWRGSITTRRWTSASRRTVTKGSGSLQESVYLCEVKKK